MRTVPVLLLLAASIAACGGTAASDAPIGFPQPVLGTAATLLGPWRTTPLALDPVLVAAIDRACRADIPMPPLVSLVVVDARGAGSVQPFYAGPDGSSGSCTDVKVLPDGRVQPSGGGSTGIIDIGLPMQPFEMRHGSTSGQGGGDGPVTMTVVSGQAGAGIAHVVIQLPGQPSILTSLSNGWYAAWWPGPVLQGSKVVGYDSAGQPVVSGDL